MVFVGSFRAGSSGLRPHHPSPGGAAGPRWSLGLGRTRGRCAGGWTWARRNGLLCVLQKRHFPFVENSPSPIFFSFLFQRNILDMRNFIWIGNSRYCTCREGSVQFFQQIGGRAGKRAWFSWTPFQSSVHRHTASARLSFGQTYLSHRAANLGKGWSNNPNFCFFFYFSFRSRDPRAVSELAPGNAILIPLKILVLLVGSFVQHFPSQSVLWGWTFSRCWLCGKKKKEGQISFSLDSPGEWFSSRDPNLKPLLPVPP